MPRNSPIPLHQIWPRTQFARFRGCVAYISGTNKDGDERVATCFHVGDGVFVTARHVVDGLTIGEIGFDDQDAIRELVEHPMCSSNRPGGTTSIVSGPHFHPDNSVDVACFKAVPFPAAFIPLGGHLSGALSQYELVLDRALVLGYPPIPFSNRPVLVASLGEINAVVDKYTGGHPHFIVSTLARGGFSGGPVLIGYNEANEIGGTAALGLVTESLVRDGAASELGYLAVLTVEPIYDCLQYNSLLPPCQAFDTEDSA